MVLSPRRDLMALLPVQRVAIVRLAWKTVKTRRCDESVEDRDYSVEDRDVTTGRRGPGILFQAIKNRCLVGTYVVHRIRTRGRYHYVGLRRYPKFLQALDCLSVLGRSLNSLQVI